MSAYDRPGALSNADGAIPFGPSAPTLCVNDQCGYEIERPQIQAELCEGRFDSLVRLAAAGLELGAPVFNVQLMAEPVIHLERKLLPRLVEAVYERTGACVAVDSRDPLTVDAALAAYPYKALCNAVNGEHENLRTMLPIIARHGAAIGTALVYERGVPQTVQERLLVARRIVEAAEAHGVPHQDVMIDAVCLPSSVMPDSMRVTLETIKAIHEELGAPVLLGISNAGHLMPEPRLLDLAYFAAAVSWGLDVAMIDPCTPLLPWITRGLDFLTGIDPYARGYLSHYRSERRRSLLRPSPNQHPLNLEES
jgi:5-methyltetrahydrofolate--homocysteine methyltransferase